MKIHKTAVALPAHADTGKMYVKIYVYKDADEQPCVRAQLAIDSLSSSVCNAHVCSKITEEDRLLKDWMNGSGGQDGGGGWN